MKDQRYYWRMGLMALILLGAILVVAPLIAAILFAAILCLTTWPLMARLESSFRGRSALAALVMTLLLAAAVLLPMSYLAATLADGITVVFDRITAWFDAGDWAPPEWLTAIPMLGPHFESVWNKLAGNQDEVVQLGQQLFEPARKLLLAGVGVIGQGLLQLVLVIFIAFFFYRDGRRIAARISALAGKVGGEFGDDMLALAHTTVLGVMVGTVGTAIAQSVVALVGFLIAGVPGALVLAGTTFFLSLIPIGPPLIWGGAAWWLFQEGRPGWAIFMVVYGVAAISSIDNFVRPLLISRTARLPMLPVALGVIGGVPAFGFVGIFLGPVMLALAIAVIDRLSPANPAPESRNP